MVQEFEFYHGIVFAALLHSTNEEVIIKPFPTSDNASYVINRKIGIYIKYSKKRLTPWRFSFQKRHKEEILELKRNFDSVFILLVCHDDGIVVLSFEEVKIIINPSNEDVEWISATRGRRKMYHVEGSNGVLKSKLGLNDFPTKIF